MGGKHTHHQVVDVVHVAVHCPPRRLLGERQHMAPQRLDAPPQHLVVFVLQGGCAFVSTE